MGFVSVLEDIEKNGEGTSATPIPVIAVSSV